MKILIVDDDEDIRILLTSALKGRGHSVVAAADGNAALDHARETRPDLILSDILMPDMDGYELCRRIRGEKSLRDIPFILFSGIFLEQEDMEFGKSIGVTDFLSKPLDLRSLVPEIEAVAEASIDNNQQAATSNIVKLKPLNQDDRTKIQLVTHKLYSKVQELSREKEALELKEEQLHLITDSLPEMMAEVDTGFRYLYVNKAYARTYGFLQRTVRGVHVRDVVGKQTYAMIRSKLAKAAKGEKISFKVWMQIEPGNPRYIWLRLVPRTDATHKVIAVVIFMSDITHLHEVETALRERESLLSSLLSNMPLALFAVDSGGLITVSEGTGLGVLGADADRNVGESASTVFSGFPRMLEFIERALKGEQFSAETILNGRELELIFTPQYDEDGKFGSTVCLMVDQSERARLQKEVALVSTMEQKRIGQDLHDSLGQLLTGISLLSKALESKLIKASSPAAEDARKMSALASEATRITKQAVSGLLPVVTEDNGLQMALQTLAEHTQELGAVPCKLDLDANIPNLDHQYATQIYLILSEAVNNSIKHAGAREIVIGSKELDEGYLFYARDTRSGKAIPKKRYGGMGLNIMEYRSRMIGANLEIDWTDSGTEVSCFLPILKQQSNS